MDTVDERFMQKENADFLPVSEGAACVQQEVPPRTANRSGVEHCPCPITEANTVPVVALLGWMPWNVGVP